MLSLLKVFEFRYPTIAGAIFSVAVAYGTPATAHAQQPTKVPSAVVLQVTGTADSIPPMRIAFDSTGTQVFKTPDGHLRVQRTDEGILLHNPDLTRKMTPQEAIDAVTYLSKQQADSAKDVKY